MTSDQAYELARSLPVLETRLLRLVAKERLEAMHLEEIGSSDISCEVVNLVMRGEHVGIFESAGLC